MIPARDTSTYLNRVRHANLAFFHHYAANTTRSVAHVAYGGERRVFCRPSALAAHNGKSRSVMAFGALEVKAVFVRELFLGSSEQQTSDDGRALLEEMHSD